MAAHESASTGSWGPWGSSPGRCRVARCRAPGTSHDFDAAVIAKDEDGKVRIVKKHEQPTRHGAAVGLAWGLAAGVVAALFPPVGIGIAAAGGVGAAIGGVAGHASGGMSRSDLKDLGEALDAGQAGLVAVYEVNLPTRWPRTSRPPTASSPGPPTWRRTSWLQT